MREKPRKDCKERISLLKHAGTLVVRDWTHTIGKYLFRRNGGAGERQPYSAEPANKGRSALWRAERIKDRYPLPTWKQIQIRDSLPGQIGVLVRKLD